MRLVEQRDDLLCFVVRLPWVAGLAALFSAVGLALLVDGLVSDPSHLVLAGAFACLAALACCAGGTRRVAFDCARNVFRVEVSTVLGCRSPLPGRLGGRDHELVVPLDKLVSVEVTSETVDETLHPQRTRCCRGEAGWVGSRVSVCLGFVRVSRLAALIAPRSRAGRAHSLRGQQR
jgi:hypothetical protein